MLVEFRIGPRVFRLVAGRHDRTVYDEFGIHWSEAALLKLDVPLRVQTALGYAHRDLDVLLATTRG